VGLRLAAAVAALLCGTALAADPYPNQSGAVGPADLNAAAEAMRATAGAGAKLSLLASGRRADVVYAVFAAAPEQTIPILSTQRRLLCTSGPGAPWTCAPQVFYRFAQGRLTQSFSYQAKGVAEDPQMPFRIVGYFANCVDAMPAIAEVIQDAKRVTVTAGSGDVYVLTDTPQDKESERCPFTPQTVQRGKSAALAEQKATESAPQAVAQQAPAALDPPAAAAPASGLRRLLGLLAGIAVIVNLGAALGALGMPFFVRRKRGRRAAAMTSTLFTATTVAAAIASIVFIRFSAMPGAGRYLGLVVPATVLAVVSCVYWSVVGMLAARAARPKKA
jgi:hypothetical protein